MARRVSVADLQSREFLVSLRNAAVELFEVSGKTTPLLRAYRDLAQSVDRLEVTLKGTPVYRVQQAKESGG